MDLMFLLTIVIIILIVFFIISIMKKLIKIGLIFAIIFIILFFITGGSIMNDFSNIKGKITNSPSIVLLENEGDIITGLIDGEQYQPLDDAEIALINGLYNEKKFKEILEDNYKLFVIKSNALDELNGTTINNKEVSTQEIKDALISDKDIPQITPEDIAVEIDIDDETTALFAYVYDKEIKLTKLFFENYKEKKIIIYPETIFFKFTKIIPLSWIDSKLNKLKDSVKEKAKETVTGAAAFMKKEV